MSSIELHCHSSASDGALAPAQLIAFAAERGIHTLALTDHDTIAGHAEAERTAAQIGVRFVPGIEISALSEFGEIHILGYGVRPASQDLADTIAGLRDAREGRAKAILARLRELGLNVSLDRVRAIAGDSMLGRPHIARAMVEAGLVRNTQHAFDDYLADGKPAHVPMRVLDPAQAIALIHDCGGATVVAHAGLYACDVSALVRQLAAHGLDGVEAFYPLHAAETIRTLQKLAAQLDLVCVGGSDFHTPLAEVRLGEIELPDGALPALDARIAAYAKRSLDAPLEFANRA